MSISSKAGNYIHTTNLNLRASFFDKADDYVKDIDGPLCMITADIMNFHYYNKWYGRESGDKLLTIIGDFLYKLQNEHNVLCGYMGGDNFTVIFPYSGYLINIITDEIQEIVRAYAKTDLSISAVFGAYTNKDSEDEVDVVDMYDYTTDALKNIRDNAINWYDINSDKKHEEELRMLPEIINALDNQEFLFYLQPKCHLKTKKIIGAEALVRWISPIRGTVSPGIFIPLLENHKLITNLDLVIWEQVCATIKMWQDEGIYVPPVSVNVSRVDILQLDVALTFEHLLQKYDLDPSKIEVEITESAYTDDEDLIINTVNRLHDIGLKVLIDDFGSGYSSLNILKDIPADVLKLDMKFLRSNNDNNDDKSNSIIESVLEMSRKLKIPSIIEGVELDHQVNSLIDLGCEYAQGYYYYKPMPIDDFKSLLKDQDKVGQKLKNSSKHIPERSHLHQFYDYFEKCADVDIISGTYTFLKVDDLHRKINTPECATIFEYSKRFVDQGIIHKDDADEYLKYYDSKYLLSEIKKGKRQFLNSLRYLYDNEYRWITFEIKVPEDFNKKTNPICLFTWKSSLGKITLDK